MPVLKISGTSARLILDRLTHTVQTPASLKSDKFQALSSRFGMKSLQRAQAEDLKD